jgi:nucleoside-diphosphate-sugar epimerase
MRNVLITGALGRIGTALIDHLADRDAYEFTYLDRESHPEYDVHVADIADYDAIRPAFDGQDAVVHLAGNPSPGAPWDDILQNNVIGTYNVLEAACDAGVETVMFASTNHVVGKYPDEWNEDLYRGAVDRQIDHTDPVRPDSYYAVSKLFGEHLGRYYVEDKAAPERFYAVRIGWVLDREYDHPYGPAEQAVAEGKMERGDSEYERRVATCKSMWCSRRDMAQLTGRVLQDESVEFDVFYARSRGSIQWLDIEHTREVLGYDPVDDADEYEEPPN